jgi:hypothetical protein
LHHALWWVRTASEDIPEMDWATALSYGPFFWKYPHPEDLPYSSFHPQHENCWILRKTCIGLLHFFPLQWRAIHYMVRLQTWALPGRLLRDLECNFTGLHWASHYECLVYFMQNIVYILVTKCFLPVLRMHFYYVLGTSLKNIDRSPIGWEALNWMKIYMLPSTRLVFVTREILPKSEIINLKMKWFWSFPIARSEREKHWKNLQICIFNSQCVAKKKWKDDYSFVLHGWFIVRFG